MKKIISYILLIIVISLTIGAITVHADDDNSERLETANLAFQQPYIPKPTFLPGPDEELQRTEGGARTILGSRILPKMAIGMVGFMGITAILFLIVGGVRFATAYGNDEAVEKAKHQIMYSLIGLLIALLAYTIVSIVINIRYEGDQSQRDSTEESTTEELPAE